MKLLPGQQQQLGVFQRRHGTPTSVALGDTFLGSPVVLVVNLDASVGPARAIRKQNTWASLGPARLQNINKNTY